MKRILMSLVLVATAFSASAQDQNQARGLPQAQAIDEVRQHFAGDVYRQQASSVHYEQPHALLRAVVVLRIRLGSDGRWAPEVLRENLLQPEMTLKALASVAAMPVPDTLEPAARRELRTNGFVEVWLFQNDGRFALKTLAKPQKDS